MRLLDGIDHGGVLLEVRLLVADLVEQLGLAGGEELAERGLAIA